MEEASGGRARPARQRPSNSIVSDAKEKGFLRLRPGGDPREVSSFPGEAAAKFLVGLLLAAGPNVALWLYFGR